jgi:hypothetical protein
VVCEVVVCEAGGEAAVGEPALGEITRGEIPRGDSVGREATDAGIPDVAGEMAEGEGSCGGSMS